MTTTLLSHSVFSLKPWLDFWKKWQKWAKKKRLLTRMQNKNKSWICLCLAGKTICWKLRSKNKVKLWYTTAEFCLALSNLPFLSSYVNRQPISVFYAHGVMKYSIIAFPVTLCLMHVLAGKFAWRNERKLHFNNNKKKPAKDCKKHWQCLEKTPLLVKFLNHNFFYSPRTITKKLVP